MNKNEKGFSALEILIVVVVLGVISAAGLFVFNNNKSSQVSNVTDNPGGKDECITSYNPPTTSSWQLHSKGKLSFYYPADWKLTESDVHGGGTSFRLESPDFKLDADRDNGLKSGTTISIVDTSIPNDFSAASYENTLKQRHSSANDGYPKRIKLLKINCKEVVQYEDAASPFGKKIKTKFPISDNSSSSIEMEYAIANEESSLDIYEQLLETVDYHNYSF